MCAALRSVDMRIAERKRKNTEKQKENKNI
jgi:hypothetical protein